MVHQQITLQTIQCASHHSLEPSVEGIPLMADDITLQIFLQATIDQRLPSERTFNGYKHDYLLEAWSASAGNWQVQYFEVPVPLRVRSQHSCTLTCIDTTTVFTC